MEQNNDTGVEKPYWTVPKKLLALFLCAVLIISGASLIFQTYRDYKNRSVWVVEADGIKICPGETKARKLQKADYTIMGEGSGWNQRVEANRYTVVAVKKATGKTLFVLDEPTTGLHTDDIKRLLAILQKIVDNGDTVLVIEHNLDVIKVADYIIDLGPEGGDNGGEIVALGTPEDISKNKNSYTGQFLKKLL